MSKPTRPQLPPASVQQTANQRLTRETRTPKAPPPYKPLKTPRCLQLKAATPQSHPRQANAPDGSRPAYHTQPRPNVLQRKPAAATPLGSTKPSHAAPPAHSPQAVPQVSRAKMSAGRTARSLPGAPPPCRSLNAPRCLQPKAQPSPSGRTESLAPAHTHLPPKLRPGLPQKTPAPVKLLQTAAHAGDVPTRHPAAAGRAGARVIQRMNEPGTKKQRREESTGNQGSTSLIPTNTPAALRSEEILANIFKFLVGEMEEFLGRMYVVEPNAQQLSQLRLVCKEWQAAVNLCCQTCGFYPKEVRVLINKINERLTIPSNLKVGKSVKSSIPLITDNEAYGIHDMARTILHEYPPQTSVYISLGSSPTIVTQYIKMCIPTVRLYHVPLSTLSLETMNESNLENIFRYVDNIVGNELVSEKSVILIDISEQGRALATMKHLVNLYRDWKLQDAQVKPKLGEIVMLALNKELPKNKEITKLQERFGAIKTLKTYSNYVPPVQEQILAKEFKDNLKLTLFDRHEVYDISSGTLTSPQINPGLIERMLIVLHRIRQYNKSYYRPGLQEKWVWDNDDRCFY